MTFRIFLLCMMFFVLGSLINYALYVYRAYRKVESMTMRRVKSINVLSDLKLIMKPGDEPGVKSELDRREVITAIDYALWAIIQVAHDTDDPTIFSLTDPEIAALKTYAKNYDNDRLLDCTHMPLVTVQDITYEEVADACGDHTWYRVGEQKYVCKSIKELNEYLREFYELHEEVYEGLLETVEKFGCFYDGPLIIESFDVETRYNPVAYFLTHEAANKYIEYQCHNLANPMIISVSLGYGNVGDLDTLINLALRYGIFLGKVDSHEI